VLGAKLALLALLLEAGQSAGSGAGRSTGAARALGRETLRLRVVEHGRVGVEALGHLVADEVDEALENRRHVDVVLRRRLVKLQT